MAAIAISVETTMFGQTVYGKGGYWVSLHKNLIAMAYGRDKFSQKVGDAIESMTKKFVAQWTKDNA
jgi:hypothetical protein